MINKKPAPQSIDDIIAAPTVDAMNKINASTESESESTSASKFIIKKGSAKKSRTTVTYRLDSNTVSKIDDIAFAARKSINETVQELLDWAINNVEME